MNIKNPIETLLGILVIIYFINKYSFDFEWVVFDLLKYLIILLVIGWFVIKIILRIRR